MQGFACDNPVGTAAANALPCVNQDVVEKVRKFRFVVNPSFFLLKYGGSYLAERTRGNPSCKAYAGRQVARTWLYQRFVSSKKMHFLPRGFPSNLSCCASDRGVAKIWRAHNFARAGHVP